MIKVRFIVMFSCIFSVNMAFGLELSIKEGKHEKIVKIPDNATQTISLSIDRNNAKSESEDKILLTIYPDKDRVCAPNKSVAGKAVKKVAKASPVSRKKPNKVRSTAVSREESNVTTVSRSTTYVAAPKKNYKTIRSINVYHYFYPCSANPRMKNCIPDDKIEIDNRNDRMVVVDGENVNNIDIVDATSKITIVPNYEKNRYVAPVNNNNPVDSVSINDNKVINKPRQSAPLFDPNAYQPRSIPMNDDFVRIDESYSNERIGVVKVK